MSDLDVIVVGAGLSGIGAAYRLKTECPTRRFVILEARDAIGGTWDLFRYPGVRSDSDMFTLGYPFFPWTAGKAIADGPAILSYIREAATTFGLDPLIKYGHRVVDARWSSADARWTLDVEAGGRRETYRCAFLYLCCGYYRYDAAHAPSFPGIDRFAGRVVHPQWWPADLDYAGQRVVVIGSGATAVTIVPAMAERAAHVTMLQRSPTYFLSRPDADALGDFLRARLPPGVAHRLIRGRNATLGLAFYQLCRRFPDAARKLLRSQVARLLPADYPVDRDFAPSYQPWDQRLCVVPEGDFFRAMRAGKASVVTDTIAEVTPSGIRTTGGHQLDADLLVMATGLELLPWGGVALSVDDRAIAPRDTVVYKGMMLSDVPNFAFCVGYTNASWTLRADLSSRNVCRLLNHMARRRYTRVTPKADPTDRGRRPLLDLASGYVQRAAPHMPQQGDRAPWYLRQNYLLDWAATTFGRITDRALHFSR